MTQSKQDFQFNYVSIESPRVSDRVDIKSLVTDFDMFEDLQKAYMTGSCIFSDGQDILGKLDLIGGEKLHVSLKSLKKDTKAIRKTFYITSYQAQKGGDNEQAVLLNLVEEHAFDSQLKNISRYYQGKISTVLTKLIGEKLNKKVNHLGTDRKTVNVIIPNLSPLESIDFLTGRACTDTGYPFFCYSVLAGQELYFRDLITLLQTPTLTRKGGEVFPYSAMSMNSKSPDPKQRNKTILDYSFDAEFTLFDMMKAGFVGAEYEIIDSLGKRNKFNFDITKDLFQDLVENIYERPQINPPFSTLTKVDGIGLSEHTSRTISSISGSGAYRTTDNDDDYTTGFGEERTVAEYKQKIRKDIVTAVLAHAPVNIVIEGQDFVDGDKHTGVGNTIDVVIPNSNPDLREPDHKRTGKYLIASCRYMFKKNRVEVALQLVKLGNDKRR